MAKHLPQQGKHSSGDDVKVYRRVREDEEEEIKIYRGSGRRPEHTRTQKARREEAERVNDAASHMTGFSFKVVLRVIIAAAAFVLCIFMPFEGWKRTACFLVPFIIVGADILLSGVEQASEGKTLNPCLIMTVGCIAAFIIGSGPTAAAAMILFNIGAIVETLTKKRSVRSIDEMADKMPDRANVETSEGILTVAPEYVNVDDIVVVEPGERIPLDGVVIEGMSSVDLSILTGSTTAHPVSEGGRVFSGTVNLSKTLRIRVILDAKNSAAGRIEQLIRNTADRPSYVERLAAAAEKYYYPAVLIMAALCAVIPPIFVGGWSEWLYRAVGLLLIAGTSSSISTVAMSFRMGIGMASMNGVLIRNSGAVETLAKTETMVFDKTGTITNGKFTITDVVPKGVSEEELIGIAALAEGRSRHPVARALRSAAGIRPGQGRLSDFEELPGRGIIATVNDSHVLVGNGAMMEDWGVEFEIPSRSGAAIHVAVDGVYRGYILIADKLRSGAFQAMEDLRSYGIKKLVMLTGDVPSVARPIASRLNFDMLRTEQTGEDKVAALEYILSNAGEVFKVAFVGDGYYDAPLLKRAHVGIAAGALGCWDAVDSADIMGMDDDISKLPSVYKNAKSVRLIADENMAFSLVSKLVIIALCVTGAVPIGVIAGLDLAAFVLTALNTLRIAMPGKKKRMNFTTD